MTASAARTDERALVITRTFDAPRNIVWKAWSEADRLAQWWGPKSFTITVRKFDFRPGGIFHYRMRTPDGRDIWGRFTYREIVAPERIVFINSFSDENGGVTRNPWDANWPLEMLNTQTFTEQGDKTTIDLRVVAINASETERKTFEAGFDSMRQGYGGTLDKLAAYLASA